MEKSILSYIRLKATRRPIPMKAHRLKSKRENWDKDVATVTRDDNQDQASQVRRALTLSLRIYKEPKAAAVFSLRISTVFSCTVFNWGNTYRVGHRSLGCSVPQAATTTGARNNPYFPLHQSPLCSSLATSMNVIPSILTSTATSTYDAILGG